MEQQEHDSTHVLIFPLPAQGHVNSMLNLAELLVYSGLSISFLNSHHNHDRLAAHTNVLARFSKYPNFQFQTISDGLPIDHPRTGESLMEVFDTLSKEIVRDKLVSFSPPVDCIIGDGSLGVIVEVAKELQIPIIHFRTISACCFWAYFCIPEMIEAGQLPFKENQDMDSLVKTVPGMETFLRYRDLPSFCRASDLSQKNFQLVLRETQRSKETAGLILNTFEDLESPILSHIQRYCPKIYTIGPLHLHHQTRFLESADMMARLARSAVSEGGSSYCNLDRLIQDIKSMIHSKA
ncbi:hypothetical protein ACFE04_029542 [Oxalis oulophora]